MPHDPPIALGLLICLLFLSALLVAVRRFRRRRKNDSRKKPLPSRDAKKRGSPLEMLAARPLVADPNSCDVCQSGRLLSFNWKRAGSDANGDLPKRSAFALDQQLRAGRLYRCVKCAATWHLDAQEGIMSAVPADRVPLILEWNRGPIIVSKQNAQVLEAIGATPADKYGNGRQYRETPCSVTTVGGELMDLAVVSIQAHAPFEPHRNYRLASEISSVAASPHALPLDVRIATSRAEEVRMGLAPTIIEMSDGKRFTLNWRAHFFVKEGYRAADARALDQGVFPLPELVDQPKEVVYFVADG